MRNEGGASTTFGFHIGFYLSKDHRFSSLDQKVGETRTGLLAPGQQRRIKASFTIPATQALGQMFLLTVLDSRRVIREVTRNNNTVSRLRTIGHFGSFKTIGKNCVGSFNETIVHTASMQNEPRPAIGTQIFYQENAKGRAVLALFALGFSKDLLGAIKLPFVLPGTQCTITNSQDILIPVPTLFTGRFDTSVTIPKDPKLIGVVYYSQFINLDAAANSLGLTTSSTIVTEIGSH